MPVGSSAGHTQSYPRCCRPVSSPRADLLVGSPHHPPPPIAPPFSSPRPTFSAPNPPLSTSPPPSAPLFPPGGPALPGRPRGDVSVALDVPVEQLGNAQTAQRHIPQSTHERLYLLPQRPMLRQEIWKRLSGALVRLEQWKEHEVFIPGMGQELALEEGSRFPEGSAGFRRGLSTRLRDPGQDLLQTLYLAQQLGVVLAKVTDQVADPVLVQGGHSIYLASIPFEDSNVPP